MDAPRSAVDERRGLGPSPQLPEPSPLLEREHELRALESAIAAAAQGAGQIVVVEGPPGMGKSRLLADARASARRQGVLVLEGRGAELEREFAFGVARQLLEQTIFGLDEDERSSLFDGAAGLAGRVFDGDPEDATRQMAGRIQAQARCLTRCLKRSPRKPHVAQPFAPNQKSDSRALQANHS